MGGVALNTATVEPRGLQYDRRWMLVDEEGKFLTQRTFAEMALLQVSLLPDGLAVQHQVKNMSTLKIPFSPTTNNEYKVQIWDDFCPAIEVSYEANAWFIAALGRFCRLVFMPDHSLRQADLEYAAAGDIVSFADGFPLLLIGQTSLDELNRQLTEPVPMNRFRPNLVFTGGTPHTEDLWHTFQIGNLVFRGVKPCGRCVVTTIDQETTKTSAEPLKTLAQYRVPENKNKVMFGQNVIPDTYYKSIKVGDKIQVLETL